MGYKRKARIVFLAGSDRSLATMAAEFANTLGAKWMEGKTVGISLVTKSLSESDTRLLQWADLVVTLDEEAEKCCPPLPTHIQKKHYPFEMAEESNIAAYRKVRNAIRSRIEGMIGGMTMLEKDAS